MMQADVAKRHDTKSLNIWLITVGEPLPLEGTSSRPWRTGLLANELLSRGHAVTWWTSAVDHFTKTYFKTASITHVRRGFELRLLHGCLYTRNISLARFRNHVQIAERFAEQAAQIPKPDVIVCSLPTIELSREAVRFASRHAIPVLLDIRDLWPDEMAARLPRLLQPLAKLILWPLYRDLGYALRGASGLLAISSHYLEWGLRGSGRHRAPADGVFTHGYPAASFAATEETARSLAAELRLEPGRKIVWFVGTFVGSIDLGTVIEAARLIERELPLVFILTGSGEKDAEWREQARGLGNVIFTGWRDSKDLAALASLAWAGLGAYKVGALMSLTNKLFEYMSCGLPILLSLPGEARELVEAAGCGKFYQPGSAESLAAVLRELDGDPAAHARMARNARTAFDQRYSADAVYEQMATHVEAIAVTGLEPAKSAAVSALAAG